MMLRTRGTRLDRQAAELDSYYRDIWRNFSSRKARTRLQQGAAAELSPVQLQALALLGEGPMRIGALAEGVGLAESTVTRLVDRLERHGLAAREVSSEDRRVVTVKLTPAGKRVEQAAARRRLDYLVGILESLDPSDRDELVRLFAKIAAVQADAAPATRTRRRIS